MKQAIRLILILSVALLAVAFTALNAQKVDIDFYFLRGSYYLPLVVLVCVIGGVLLGWIFAIIPSIGKTRKLKQVEKKLVTTEKEVENLRKIPLTDEH